MVLILKRYYMHVVYKKCSKLVPKDISKFEEHNDVN